MPDIKTVNNANKGLGIDLGLKQFAVMSNGVRKKNISKTARMKKTSKTIKKKTALPIEKIRRLKETQSKNERRSY